VDAASILKDPVRHQFGPAVWIDRRRPRVFVDQISFRYSVHGAVEEKVKTDMRVCLNSVETVQRLIASCFLLANDFYKITNARPIAAYFRIVKSWRPRQHRTALSFVVGV
jgi:hypothetical protein